MNFRWLCRHIVTSILLISRPHPQPPIYPLVYRGGRPPPRPTFACWDLTSPKWGSPSRRNKGKIGLASGTPTSVMDLTVRARETEYVTRSHTQTHPWRAHITSDGYKTTEVGLVILRGSQMSYMRFLILPFVGIMFTVVLITKCMYLYVTNYNAGSVGMRFPFLS